MQIGGDLAMLEMGEIDFAKTTTKTGRLTLLIRMAPFANFSLHTLHAARPDFANSITNFGAALTFLVDMMVSLGVSFHCWSGGGRVE